MNNSSPLPTPLAAALTSLGFGPAQTALNLTLVPLLNPGAPAADYLPLDVALAKGLAEVTEVSESGSVPELFFRNRGRFKVLLVDGEELVGARQNRVLNLSVLAAPESELKIPVSCVEQGRWSYRSRAFRSEGRALHARARAEKMAAVSESLRSHRQARSDQGALWQEIGRKSAAMEVRSETAAMAEIFDARRDQLADYRRAFRSLPGQIGAAFLVGHRLAGLELFDAASTLDALLPKLADSYAMDALEQLVVQHGGKDWPPEQSAELATDTAKAFIARLLAAKPEQYPGIGLGTTVRLDGPSLRAGALMEAERLLHLSAYVA